MPSPQDPTSTPDGARASADSSLPLFYKSPRPLDIERDAELRISPPKFYNFAAKANAIPLLVDEFPMAAAHYPIVFAEGPTPVPAVILGLKADENLFVDSGNRWDDGAYLPAYVRRYPFLLMEDPAAKQFVLCIEEDPALFGTTGEYGLFQNGAPTNFTKSAMEFCSVLRQQGETTDAFIKALQEQNLLVPYDSEVTLPDGTRLQLGGFLTIDPRKFDALPDNVFLTWRRNGWIGLIYAQLLSSHRWHNLVLRSRSRG